MISSSDDFSRAATPIKCLAFLGIVLLNQIANAQELPLTNPSLARPRDPFTILQKPMDLPPVLPSALVKFQAASDGAQIAAVMFNQTLIQRLVESQWKVAFDDGANEARRLGQKGFLIRVEVMTEPVEAGEFLSLRGGQGVTLVGIGPNPGAVCLAASCFDRLVPKTSSVQSVSPASSYYWVKDAKESFEADRFDLKALESSANLAALNREMRMSIESASQWEFVSDYAEKLAKSAKDEESARAVNALIARRGEAAAKMKRIEVDLAAEMARAKIAAETANSIRAYANIVTVGTAINTVRVNLGEDAAKKVAGAKSNSQIAAGVDGIATQSSIKIKSLIGGRAQVVDELSNVKATILEAGAKSGMAPSRYVPLLRTL